MSDNINATLKRVCSYVTEEGFGGGLPHELQSELEAVLSPQCLSTAFIDDAHSGSIEHPGIQYDLVMEAFKPLEQQHEELLRLIARIVKDKYKEIGATLCQDPSNVGLLRAVLVLLLCPVYSRPDEAWSREMIVHLGETLLNIEKCQTHQSVLQKWLLGDRRLLRRAVRVFLGALKSATKSQAHLDISDVMHVFLQTLKILHKSNEEGGCPVKRRVFYLDELLEKGSCFDLFELDFLSAHEQHGKKICTWLDFPFVLDVPTKWNLFSSEASHIQGASRGSIVFNDVNRDSIISSAMENVDRCGEAGLEVWLWPLEVNFGRGEYAIDIGGPSKEFFFLLFAALMKPELSIFRKVNERSDVSPVWFNPENKDLVILEKIGLLFALMLFNSRVVTVRFPVLLYKILLKPEILLNPQDLASFDEEQVGKLERLRHLSEDELEARYLTFENLKAGGENECVEKANLDSYIEMKKMHMLAPDQVRAFAKGFNLVARSSRVLMNIFQPEELRDVLLGGRRDWKRFEKSTRYVSPYSAEHRVVKTFWAAFHTLDESDRRQFLIFLTGADHVPITGVESLAFTIKRLDARGKYSEDPAKICPEVMTCPGIISMDLPEYETVDDVRFRLLKAMDIGRGFHRE